MVDEIAVQLHTNFLYQQINIYEMKKKIYRMI